MSESTNKYIRAFRESCRKLEEDLSTEVYVVYVQAFGNNQSVHVFLNQDDANEFKEYAKNQPNVNSVWIKTPSTNLQTNMEELYTWLEEA